MIGRIIILLALVAGATAGELRSTSRPVNFCQGCRSLVSFVRETFNSSNDREQNKEIVNSYCELYYPASTDYQQGPCPMFVEGFFYVVDHIDPVHHCDQIGACGKPTDDSFKMMSNNNNKMMTTRGSKVVCEFCEQIVEQTQATLSDPKLVDIIRTQIDGLCDYLVVVRQDKQCKQLAHQYLDQAVEFIKSIDALDYCKSISMCPAVQRRRLSGSKSAANLPTLTDFNNFGIETSVVVGPKEARNRYELELAKTGHRRGPNCMLCKTIVKEMFHFLKNNKTEANIMHGLDEICHLIYRPGAGYDQCQSMVKAYTKEIIQLLIDETDPEVICMLLDQCQYDSRPSSSSTAGLIDGPTTAGQHQMGQNKSPKYGLGQLITALDSSIGLNSAKACLECKLFIRYIKNELGDQRSQEYVRNWLIENLCARMSDKEMNESCTKMVNDYSDTFLKAVAGSINEKEACAELGVCQQRLLHRLVIDALTGGSTAPTVTLTTSPAVAAQRRRQQVASITGALCDRCIQIVTEIDEYLSTHSVDQDVKVLIDQVCNKLPEGGARDECTFVVKYFGSEIVQIIAGMDNPRQVCSKIYQC